jgi:hypothetical protein
MRICPLPESNSQLVRKPESTSKCGVAETSARDSTASARPPRSRPGPRALGRARARPANRDAGAAFSSPASSRPELEDLDTRSLAVAWCTDSLGCARASTSSVLPRAARTHASEASGSESWSSEPTPVTSCTNALTTILWPSVLCARLVSRYGHACENRGNRAQDEACQFEPDLVTEGRQSHEATMWWQDASRQRPSAQ